MSYMFPLFNPPRQRKPDSQTTSYLTIALFFLGAFTTLVCCIMVLFAKDLLYSGAFDVFGMAAFSTCGLLIRYLGAWMYDTTQFRPWYFMGLGMLGAAVLTFIVAIH
jgi:hypothetical protein